jgi:hypothetical protein
VQSMFVPSLSWQNASSFYSNQKRTDAYPFLRFLRFLLVLASSPIHEASSTSTPSSSTFPPGPNVTGRPCTKITIRGFFKATSAASSCICTPGRSREMRSVPSPQVPAPASALKSALRMGRPPSLNLRGMHIHCVGRGRYSRSRRAARWKDQRRWRPQPAKNIVRQARLPSDPSLSWHTILFFSFFT